MTVMMLDFISSIWGLRVATVVEFWYWGVLGGLVLFDIVLFLTMASWSQCNSHLKVFFVEMSTLDYSYLELR